MVPFFKAMLLMNITILSCVGSSRILGIFPIAGGSHYILTSKLMKGLAEAGNDVTMVSPFHLKDRPKNGTYRDLVLDGFSEDFAQSTHELNLFQQSSNGPFKKMKHIVDMFVDQTNKTLRHPVIKQLIESDEKFDVVILEYVLDDALKVFANKFDCPLIILNSMGPTPLINPTVGNPQPASYIPHTILARNFSGSFISRATNLLFYVSDFILSRFYALPKNDEIMRAVYPDAPSIYDLYTNVSLVLLNSHTSINAPVPLVPNMIEIGGYFIDPPKQLPQDLEDYMNNATEGVIYFSMGSMLKGNNLPQERKQAFLNIFAKLKQKVIWKFEDDSLVTPPNVLIKKWCPQQDILAHPNMKLFITHGGLLSTTETIYHGVPILAIPVFADQPLNAAAAVEAGYALQLEYHDPDFGEEKLHYLINELLTNPKYSETAKARSRLFHDRPMKPMDTAAYWVDYVVRHRGAPHLRVAGLNLPWYKYFMLDVLGFALASILVSLHILNVLIRKLSSFIFKHRNYIKVLKKKVN